MSMLFNEPLTRKEARELMRKNGAFLLAYAKKDKLRIGELYATFDVKPTEENYRDFSEIVFPFRAKYVRWNYGCDCAIEIITEHRTKMYLFLGYE